VTRESNSFEFDGLFITLDRVTDQAVHINVTRDATDSVARIKAFVDAYNEMVSDLTRQTRERKTPEERVFTPLTDAERAAMTEIEVERRENVARKGILNRDTSIETMLRRLRSSFHEAIGGLGASAASIGLRTNSQGLIELDENRLTRALEDNPERVMAIFTQASDSDDRDASFRESGLLNRITSVFAQFNTNAHNNTLRGIENSINTANQRITRVEENMRRQEERLFLKFARMEQSLAALNSQSEWLSGMIAQMNANTTRR
jgi:flagellar hook-associated protein 2